MVKVILIGFEYEEAQLKGCIIDLYHAYKWCKTFTDDIVILTDIREIDMSENINQALQQKIIEEDILEFIQLLLKIRIIVRDKIDLILGRIKSEKRMIVYYTGHGRDNSLVLPNNELMLFSELRDIIIRNKDENSQIFFILDCCNPNGLNLAYRLNNNKFILRENCEFFKPKILLITSANEDEKSFASNLGSSFSRYLFKLLIEIDIKNYKMEEIPNKYNRNLQRLISNITTKMKKLNMDKPQTITIYSSYIIDPVLWLWIGVNKGIDVKLAEINMGLYLEKL